MKKKICSLLAAVLTVGFIACNNEGSGNASNDTTTNTDANNNSTSATTTNTSTSDYSALADSFRINSEAGNYLDPKTGKSMKISIDPETGRRINAETGEPVWRYVDKRTWWVYGGDDNNSMWDTVGVARMEGNKIMYRGDNNEWMSYDKRWKIEDERRINEWKTKTEKDGDSKMKNDDIKIKTEKDGDIKVKTKDDQKVKIDEDGIKEDNK